MLRFNNRLLWGVILVVAGILFLLQNVGLLPLGGFVWAVLFALAGAIFMGVFLQNRDNWWAIIPGLSLLGIGGVTALSVVAPTQVGPWIGGGFLFLIGLAFWVVYYLNRSYWWALIPAGVLTTLAVVAGLSTLLGGIASGGLFFVGLGLTFGLVGVVDTPMGHMKWAFIPAGILLLMGLLITMSAASFAAYITPIALMCVGVYLVWRAVAYRKA